MFDENNEHEQETLFSPIKDLPNGPKRKLQNHWSTHFYEHVFTQIEETKFKDLYHDGYSRPNKPVNELVSLEIIKQLMGLSDAELEHAYLFDFRVRNALGKETLGDNICPKTFTNFRNRLLDYEAENDQDPLFEVFEDHRDYFAAEFDIDGSTQRMDSTFIEANIKQLSRVDLIAKVLHNFLDDLPEEIVQELPADIEKFADRDNLNLSYHLDPGEVESTTKTLANHAARLVDRFEAESEYADLESFAHLQQVLDEQCYRIPELEDDNSNTDDDDDDMASDDPGDDESPGWEPIRTTSGPEAETDQSEQVNSNAATEEDGNQAVTVELKDPDDIGSETLQNPHDVDATYRNKNGESHYGYKANVSETCDGLNPFELITTICVDTNNTDDADMLAEDISELSSETDLRDLLVDGGYTHEEVENQCKDHEIRQHFSGIRGRQPSPDSVSPADAEWEGTRMVACPAGHEPFEQWHDSDSGRFGGRLAKDVCGECPHREDCFVQEKQQFYSYGFYARDLEIARRRKRLDDPEEELLQMRAGAESMINEIYQNDGEQSSFTGQQSVKNTSIAKAIGTNLKRASRFLESAAKAGEAAG